jgi:wyosine [tRNA(Phe)-imidazoG37] synthetase (radical SAM superfamily)
MSGRYSYLFGPVRSRRLGRSLGIDLVPLKVCSWDCPYCQVGATSDKTVERCEYTPLDGVLAEFDHWLAHDGQADVITLSGGGEPTLHTRFGDVIEAIGARCKLRRILLSNGSLFMHPEVRAAACKAEVVKATLSAWNQDSLEALHHPHALLKFDSYLAGLKALRDEFAGEYWLEVFVVPGLNDRPDQLALVADLAGQIRPDRVHLNTAVRPARDGSVRPVPTETLDVLAQLFKPAAEVIAFVSTPDLSALAPQRQEGGLNGRILDLIRRHPCSVADIAVSLNLAEIKAVEAVEALCRAGRVKRECRDRKEYYTAG